MFDSAREGHGNSELPVASCSWPQAQARRASSKSSLIQKARSVHVCSARYANKVKSHYFLKKRTLTGNTLLMLTAYAGHVELVHGLIQRDAGPEQAKYGFAQARPPIFLCQIKESERAGTYCRGVSDRVDYWTTMTILSTEEDLQCREIPRVNDREGQ
jgi:hypothetical protein